jgi:hypothetical protein
MGLLRMTRRERDEAEARARTVYVAQLARTQADARRHEAMLDEAERDFATEDQRVEAERPAVAQMSPEARLQPTLELRHRPPMPLILGRRLLREPGRWRNERKRAAWDQERARIMQRFGTEQREIEAAHHQALEQLEERRESALRAQGLRP